MIVFLISLLASCSVPSSVLSPDIDMNGRVGGEDIAILVSQWGMCGTADLNKNGIVDAYDLQILLAEWGR